MYFSMYIILNLCFAIDLLRLLWVFMLTDQMLKFRSDRLIISNLVHRNVVDLEFSIFYIFFYYQIYRS